MPATNMYLKPPTTLLRLSACSPKKRPETAVPMIDSAIVPPMMTSAAVQSGKSLSHKTALMPPFFVAGLSEAASDIALQQQVTEHPAGNDAEDDRGAGSRDRAGGPIGKDRRGGSDRREGRGRSGADRAGGRGQAGTIDGTGETAEHRAADQAGAVGPRHARRGRRQHKDSEQQKLPHRSFPGITEG